MKCNECGKPIEGCVEECGACFEKRMEREFHLFAEQKHTPWVEQVPEHKAKHLTEEGKVEWLKQQAEKTRLWRQRMFGTSEPLVPR